MEYEEKNREYRKLERVQRILENPLYKKHISNNEKLEADRIYCKHDMIHFLDVARIAYILSMENDLGLSKEIIYAAALLHDVGRDVQYETGEKHAKAGVPIAAEILKACGFDETESAYILDAIENHSGRGKDTSSMKPLTRIIYDADKLSRMCYACKSEKTCDWSREKKNMQVCW